MIRQLRLVVTADDYSEAIAFYRDVLRMPVAEPTQTPWRSLNARLEGPAGLQLTLFEELGPE